MEREFLAKDGFFAHLVPDETSPLGFNAHTHGFELTWNHPDLQIVFPVDGQVAMGLFWAAVAHIKEGSVFSDGDVVARIAGNEYKVKFVKVQESGRDVLRMILPDKEGNLDVETITGKFRHQYCDIIPSCAPCGQTCNICLVAAKSAKYRQGGYRCNKIKYRTMATTRRNTSKGR